MPPLRIKGLRKRYGTAEVVAGLDLEVAPGTCHGLLGPNGAGKTTTLRLALGLIDADAGEVRLLGHRMPREGSQARQRVGVVPQADNLDPDFTVRENLLVYGRYFGLSTREIEARLPALLEFAGLAGKAEAKIQTLSGGMKRRLTLARALVNDPELVFLDEPTTGLDPQARHLIWQGLRKLAAQGKTLLLTTHFMEEAERLCDRITILDRGRVIAEGPPRELIRTHVEPHVVEIYGEGVDAWCDREGRSRGPFGDATPKRDAAPWHAVARIPSAGRSPFGGPSADAPGRDRLSARHCRRCERVGETLFCYTDAPQALVAELDGIASLSYLHRPANLEDVFLKLTGRDLRD